MQNKCRWKSKYSICPNYLSRVPISYQSYCRVTYGKYCKQLLTSIGRKIDFVLCLLPNFQYLYRTNYRWPVLTKGPLSLQRRMWWVQCKVCTPIFIFVESLIQLKHEWNIKHESLPFVTFYILNWQCFEAYVMHFITSL